MDFAAHVRDCATRLSLLDDRQLLRRLDSLSIIDLITELEQTLGVEIPVGEVRQETFESIDSIAAMLARLPHAAAP